LLEIGYLIFLTDFTLRLDVNSYELLRLCLIFSISEFYFVLTFFISFVNLDGEEINDYDFLYFCGDLELLFVPFVGLATTCVSDWVHPIANFVIIIF
jgi:hypothetical protein